MWPQTEAKRESGGCLGFLRGTRDPERFQNHGETSETPRALASQLLKFAVVLGLVVKTLAKALIPKLARVLGGHLVLGQVLHVGSRSVLQAPDGAADSVGSNTAREP